MRILEVLMTVVLILAPVPKDIPPPEITAGDWETSWSGCKWYYTFYADGSCTGRTRADGQPLYIGWWQWDGKTRRLMLCETRDSWQSWVWYSFQFDRGLQSKCIDSATTGEVDETPRPVTWRFGK